MKFVVFLLVLFTVPAKAGFSRGVATGIVTGAVADVAEKTVEPRKVQPSTAATLFVLVLITSCMAFIVYMCINGTCEQRMEIIGIFVGQVTYRLISNLARK